MPLPGNGSNSSWGAQRVLQYRRDHSVATVDFSETSPVCGSRSAAAAAAQLNSHSSQMSAVVVEGARENVSFGFEFPWKGKRVLLFSRWVFFVVVVAVVVVDCHKFAAALFNMFEQQPCLYFAVAPEIAVSRIQCLVLRMANEYL